jgi:hypothetical protein
MAEISLWWTRQSLVEKEGKVVRFFVFGTLCFERGEKCLKTDAPLFTPSSLYFVYLSNPEDEGGR